MIDISQFSATLYAALQHKKTPQDCVEEFANLKMPFRQTAYLLLLVTCHDRPDLGGQILQEIVQRRLLSFEFLEQEICQFHALTPLWAKDALQKLQRSAL